MYKISITKESLYTQVTVDGRWTTFELHIRSATKVWMEIADYCNDNKTMKLLVVSKIEGVLSQISSYDITMSMEDIGLRKDIKISYVDMNKQSFKVNSFSANYMRNIGYDIEMFNNEDDAISWLFQSNDNK